MAIDPALLAQVKWDDEPAQAAGQQPLEIDITGGVSESQLAAQQAAAAQRPIDLSQVVWDDEPGAAAPTAPNPANQSAVARVVSGQPAQPQVQEGNAVGRFLGEIGGRQVMQGAAGLYGSLGGDALNHYVLDPIDRAAGWGTQLGTGGQSYRDAAGQVADQMGMRRPQNAQERIISDIGEGLTGTALTMGIGGGINALANLGRTGAAPVTNRLADLLTAQPVQQAIATAASSGASSAVRENGGSQTAQVLTGLGAGLTPAALSTAGAATTRGLVRGSSGARMQGAIDDFEALGASPSAGQAAGSGWVQGLEGLLSKGPTSGGVVGRFAEQQAEKIGKGLQSKADALSPGAGSENAGLAIERGMQAFKGDTNAVKKALYWAVDQQIPASTPTPMANTQRTLARLTTPNPSAQATTGALIQPRIAQLRNNLEADLQAGGGNLTYDALKRIRSDVGEAINGSSPLNPSSDLRELQQLYGSLSQDMLDAAKAQGPAAVKAATRANNYTRNVANRMELVQRVIDKNGGPEKVFQAAMAGTNDGATTLRGVMYSLPKDEQQMVSAAVIKRMGLATPGAQDASGDVFSAATFLTNWNKLSPESKAVLFGRYGSGFKGSMDQIARVANNIKQGAKVYANPAGSGDKVAAYSYWAGLLAALGAGRVKTAAGIAAAGIGANAAARYLTNPKAVRWLAHATTLPRGAFIAQLNTMSQQANKAGDEDMAALAADLQQAVNSQGDSANEANGR